MSDVKRLRLILGDQLNGNHSWFRSRDDTVVYVLMEVLQETGYVRHHVQKVAACFAAMRAFADKLRKRGHHVIYIPLDDPHNEQTFEGNISVLLHKGAFQRFEYLLPDEYRLDQQFRDMEERLPVPVRSYDTEHFLTERYDVKNFFTGKKQYLMESFYRSMRKKYDILMDGNKPWGGKWNYDVSNRQRYDGTVPIPDPKLFKNDVTDIVDMLHRMEVSTFGSIEPERLIWPVTRKEAQDVMHDFLKNGLSHFGTYQDAMTEQSWSLFHSRISFTLNTKMLHPLEVIDEVIHRWKKQENDMGINQIEGYVRQILGWREYMRGMYWALMPDFKAMNFFDHTGRLPHYFWDAQTRMNCMAAAISQSLEHAYAHHIQRLMVTGNFALLAGIHPDEVDDWYLGIYIDAIEWVEITNTRGMSQFADGGIIATKPYVSSAGYLHRMSDYCLNCHYDRAKRYGERACPFNSLYWDFLARHRDKLQKNPRIGMMYRTWDRFPETERKKLLKQAAVCRKALETL